MNTNNKEAIDRNLRIETLTDSNGRVYTLVPIARSNNYIVVVAGDTTGIYELLQDNEDTEGKEEPLLQNNPGHEHLPSGVGKGAYCLGCLEELDKPSSKVEKLKAIKNEVVYTTELHVIKDSLINLLNLLIEDEE